MSAGSTARLVERACANGRCACVCVCVCVSFPSILVTVPPIKAGRVLHFAAYSGHYTLQRFFFCPSKPTGVTQEGANTGPLSFPLSSMPRLLLRCLPPFFCREKGPTVPSFVDNDRMKSNFCQLTRIFSFLPLSTADYESEKKPSTIADIRTRELAARS